MNNNKPIQTPPPGKDTRADSRESREKTNPDRRWK
jgi:hypothetical protein